MENKERGTRRKESQRRGGCSGFIDCLKCVNVDLPLANLFVCRMAPPLDQ